MLVPLLGLLFAEGFDPGEDTEQELLGEERGDQKEGAAGQISWRFYLRSNLNTNHIGSRRFLERCSHAAGAVAGGRAVLPRQEGRQLGEAWPCLEEGTGSQWAQISCCFRGGRCQQ